MVSHALLTFLCIFLSIALFSIPLVIKYHVYKPQNKLLVAGEVLNLRGRLSSVWCQAVDLYSESNFRAFLYEGDPEVDENETKKTVLNHRIVLPNRAQEYWGFHLLRGSQVEVSACARLSAAEINIVKGHEGLEECLLEHAVKHHEDEFSGEDSNSESESDKDTSSISSSQGVIPNETNTCVCSNSLLHTMIPTAYNCKYPFHAEVRQHILHHNVNYSDHYYHVFASNTPLDILPNEFNVRFDIVRTHYDHSASTDNCTEGNYCRLHVDLGIQPRVVVEMSNTNGTLEELKLVMTCKPREWLFLLFYSLFLLVVFICAFQ